MIFIRNGLDPLIHIVPFSPGPHLEYFLCTIILNKVIHDGVKLFKKHLLSRKIIQLHPYDGLLERFSTVLGQQQGTSDLTSLFSRNHQTERF